MKRILILWVALVVFASCNNSASLEKRADSLEKKIDSFGKEFLDSGKVKMKNLKKTIQEKIGKKDSSNK